MEVTIEEEEGAATFVVVVTDVAVVEATTGISAGGCVIEGGAGAGCGTD